MRLIFFARYAVRVHGTRQENEIPVSAQTTREAKIKARESIARRHNAPPLWVSISTAR